MSTFNLEFLRVPDALRASSPSPSTSTSSASSYGFDQCSKTSQTSQSTNETLITPLGSINSIFGNDPQLDPVPNDLLPWHGLTDEQWELHTLVSKVESAIKYPEIGVFKELDETFFSDDIWYNDDLCDPDEEFDAVAAVRARLVKGKQTITTRRALDIINARSGLAPILIADKNSRYDEHPMACKVVVEGIEDYTKDFELGDNGVLKGPPNNKGLHRDSVPESNQEVDKNREQDSLFNVTFPSPPRYATNFLPPTPSIRPVEVVWDRPTSDSSISTPKYISQLLMSPLVLDNPAIVHNSFGNINPISPVVLFSSCRSLPTLLASLRDSGKGDITPRVHGLGLGLVGATSTAQDAGTEGSSCPAPFVAESPQYESRKSHVAGGIFEASPIFVEVETLDRDSKPLHDESVLFFGPALSPLDKMLEGLGQRVVPYVPTTLGSSIPHTEPTSNIVYATMKTVTAGCSHPAASTSFITSTMEARRAQKGMKVFGLGLPMGPKPRLSRCSSDIPTSEACQDLASLIAAPVTFNLTNSRPRGFRGPMLSPILEADDSPQPDPFPIPESKPTPSPTKKRNFFKRALKFLF